MSLPSPALCMQAVTDNSQPALFQPQEFRLLSHVQLAMLPLAVSSIHVSQNNKSSRWSRTLAHPHLHYTLAQPCATVRPVAISSTSPRNLMLAPAASRTRTTRPRANTQTPTSERGGDTNTLQKIRVPLGMMDITLSGTPRPSARAPS